MPSIGRAERALISGSIVNGGLGMATGALMAGVPGAKLGLILGLLLAALPIAMREVWAWLRRPGGLPGFVGTQIGAAAVGTAQAIANGVGSVVSPIVGLLQAPVFAVRMIGAVLASAWARLLERVWRIVATPLGMANVAATAVIFANLAGLDFASPIAFPVLGLLLLVLLVSESERCDQDAAGLEP